MVMLDKDYMISHMRNKNGTVNVKNVVMSAACEATELFQCMIQMDHNFTDWRRFIDRLENNMETRDYDKIHELCQTMYAMRHLTEELEGLYLVREDEELCSLYYQIFVEMLDLTVFSTEALLELNGGKKNKDAQEGL